MTSTVLTLAISLITIQIVDVQCEDPGKYNDWYWRDYLGVIPEDALPGGYDASGNPTYIGQIFTTQAFIPAYIYQGSDTLVGTASDVPITSKEHGKILCTRNPCKYRWISTDISSVNALSSQYTLVFGGRETGLDLYIGRVHTDLEDRIGKVVIVKHPINGIQIPFQNKRAHFTNYEILVYDQNKC